MMKCLLPVPLLAGSTFRRQPPPLIPSIRSSRQTCSVWTDTCNIYVIRDGDAALLIDLGDGSVLDQLETIGVRRVEWVLFTIPLDRTFGTNDTFAWRGRSLNTRPARPRCFSFSMASRA